MTKVSDEVDIDVSRQDVMIGDVEQYKLQSGSRVIVPEDWHEHLGIEVGDDLALIFKGDSIEIVKSNFNKISKVKDDLDD